MNSGNGDSERGVWFLFVLCLLSFLFFFFFSFVPFLFPQRRAVSETGARQMRRARERSARTRDG